MTGDFSMIFPFLENDALWLLDTHPGRRRVVKSFQEWQDVAEGGNGHTGLGLEGSFFAMADPDAFQPRCRCRFNVVRSVSDHPRLLARAVEAQQGAKQCVRVRLGRSVLAGEHRVESERVLLEDDLRAASAVSCDKCGAHTGARKRLEQFPTPIIQFRPLGRRAFVAVEDPMGFNKRLALQIAKRLEDWAGDFQVTTDRIKVEQRAREGSVHVEEDGAGCSEDRGQGHVPRIAELMSDFPCLQR